MQGVHCERIRKRVRIRKAASQRILGDHVLAGSDAHEERYIPKSSLPRVTLYDTPRKIRTLPRNLHTLRYFARKLREMAKPIEMLPRPSDEELAKIKSSWGTWGCEYSSHNRLHPKMACSQPRVLFLAFFQVVYRTFRGPTLMMRQHTSSRAKLLLFPTTNLCQRSLFVRTTT